MFQALHQLLYMHYTCSYMHMSVYTCYVASLELRQSTLCKSIVYAYTILLQSVCTCSTHVLIFSYMYNTQSYSNCNCNVVPTQTAVQLRYKHGKVSPTPHVMSHNTHNIQRRKHSTAHSLTGSWYCLVRNCASS